MLTINRGVIVLLMTSAVPWASFAKDHPVPITIKVLDATDTRGYIDPANADSIHDVERALRGCSTFRIVFPTGDAIRDYPQLTISVWRTVEKTEELFPTYYEGLNTMTWVSSKLVMTSDFRFVPEDAPYVKLIYKVGGYGRWRVAAKQVVDELAAWVNANRGKLDTR